MHTHKRERERERERENTQTYIQSQRQRWNESRKQRKIMYDRLRRRIKERIRVRSTITGRQIEK